MSRNRFVEPDKERLPLSDGDWIEVKKRLNVGEQKRLDSAGIRRQMFGPPIIDWKEYHIGRAAVWLLEWSFRDKDDRPVELTLDAIKALDPDDFDEIQDAIKTYVAGLEEIKKKMKAEKLAATSPS